MLGNRRYLLYESVDDKHLGLRVQHHKFFGFNVHPYREISDLDMRRVSEQISWLECPSVKAKVPRLQELGPNHAHAHTCQPAGSIRWLKCIVFGVIRVVRREHDGPQSTFSRADDSNNSCSQVMLPVLPIDIKSLEVKGASTWAPKHIYDCAHPA